MLDQHGQLDYAAFVPKPYRPAELIAALDGALGERAHDTGAS